MLRLDRSASTLPTKTGPRYAEWRLLTREPRSAWGWILLPSEFWFDRQARPRAIALALSGGAIFLVGWASGYLVPAFLVLLSAGAGIFLGSPRRESDLAALPTHTEADEAYPVRLSIWRGVGGDGSDQGWVTFVDGWLVYEGLRTGFALKNSDVSVWEDKGHSVCLQLVSGEWIRFAFLDRPSETGLHWEDRTATQFASEIRNWRGAPVAEGVSVFPPRVQHPESAATAARWRLLATVASALFVPLFLSSFGIFLILFIVFFLSFLSDLSNLRRLLARFR